MTNTWCRTTVSKTNAPIEIGIGRSSGGSRCVRNRETLPSIPSLLAPTEPLVVFKMRHDPDSHTPSPSSPLPLSAAEDRPPATACRSATFSRGTLVESKVAWAGNVSATTF